MKTYGQFCPVAKAAEVFCERWTPIILRDLATGATRFSELRRGAPLASPTLLSRRLKQLEAEGIVESRPAPRGRTYHLTPAGAEFAPLIEALGIWGQRWSRRELAAHEVDLGLLIWAMQRSVHPKALGPRRAVVQLSFTDQKGKRRHWWFVNDGGEVELCLDDPGFEIDLYLAATLRDMIYIWRGDLPLARALAEGRLEADGSARARRALPRWLGISTLAHVRSQRAA
ncbi:winged helix-turn-helix transcriptional regulator [Desertibaculum subflavum]|uniref:winged helix-turn-helix transcriptional regulator n=1 Tax=Desertibaculum subflavum TaxID=2268458 RepID=UPI0013C488AD